MTSTRHETLRNVVISGLTAAGKTTHTKLLADALGYRYVSASAVMAQLTGHEDDTGDSNWWSRHASELSALREDGALDRRLDAIMCELASERGGQVFDGWALPWTSSQPMVRIWLSSSLEARAMKYKVYRLPESVPIGTCREYASSKDDESRRLFSALYGFDLFEDHDVFDAVLDSTRLIDAPTRAAADAGIARLAPVLEDLGRWLLARGSSSAHDEGAIRFAASARRLPPDALVRIPEELRVACKDSTGEPP